MDQSTESAQSQADMTSRLESDEVDLDCRREQSEITLAKLEGKSNDIGTINQEDSELGWPFASMQQADTLPPSSQEGERHGPTRDVGGKDFKTRFKEYLHVRQARIAQSADSSSPTNDTTLQGMVNLSSGCTVRTSNADGQHVDSPKSASLPIRSSIGRASHHISLTPSDLLYPAAVHQNDPRRVSALLGLEPHDNFERDHDMIEGGTEPQNGCKAWMHALLAVLLVFNCWGFSNAFGLFQAYYETYYIPSSSPSAISWIGSTQLALVFGLGVPIGRAVDAGFFRAVFHGGSVLMLVSLFASSYCSTWATLWLVQGLLTGIGMGCVFSSGLFALMGWFDERHMGVAMGLPAAGSCLGGIVYILLSRHYLASKGFGPTMRILSGVSLATMIPPNILFRERRHRPQKRPQLKQGLSLGLLTDLPYLLAGIGMFFSFFGLYFGFVYLISYASQILQLSDTAATNLLIYALLANLPGRLLPALISDRWLGPLNTMIPSGILSSLLIWLWLGCTSGQSSLTIIACFYSFVSGGTQALYAPVTYTFCLESEVTHRQTRVVMDRMGVKAGGIFSCIGVAVLIGTPVGGALINYRIDRGLDHPYLGAQVLAAVSMLLGGCFLAACRMKKDGFVIKRA